MESRIDYNYFLVMGENSESRVVIFNTISHLDNILTKNVQGLGIHIVTITNIDELRKSITFHAPHHISLIVFIGELLNQNTELIKSTNFTLHDFLIPVIHRMNFDFIHIDVPITNNQQRETIINILTTTASFAKVQFGISINRSSGIDLTNTSNFSNDVSKLGQPSKTILNYCRNFLILTSSGSHHNTPISSLSTDEGTFNHQTLFSTLTHRVLITEQSLGMSDDEIASFDSVHYVSDVSSILDLMELPWESNFGNERSTIVHVTLFLPFTNDGCTTYLELPNKTRIPMSFFEEVQKKAQQKRVSRFFFPLINSPFQPVPQNDKVFVLKVKKRQKIVQQILFPSKWVTWEKAIEKISNNLYCPLKGEKIRGISPIYNKNENGINIFQNLYSIVSDFNPDSLIPFHTTNTVFCEIFQSVPESRSVLRFKRKVSSTEEPQEPPASKLAKIETLETKNSEDFGDVEEFYSQLINSNTLSIQL